MYNLYHKVFNNRYLSNIIFKYVKFQDVDFKESICSYSEYDLILGSYKTSDLTIELMLSKKMYSLFNSYFDYYFNVAIHDISRYWYFRAFNNLSKMDLYYLTRYKELGFQRFELIYNGCIDKFQELKQHQKDNNYILLNIASTGNIEIYNYLEDLGYELPIQNEFSITYNQNMDDEQLSTFFDSGGNFDIFLKLLYFYDKHLYNPDGKIRLENCSALFIWLVKKKYTDLFSYFLEMNRFLFSPKYDTNSVLVAISLSYSNMELAKLLVEGDKSIELFKKSFCFNDFLKNAKLPTNHFHIVDGFEIIERVFHDLQLIDIQVFQYYWSHYKTIQPQELKYQILKKYIFTKNFTFENANYEHGILEIQLFSGEYIPTLQEFKYLVANEQELLKKCALALLSRISIQCTSKSFDLNYLKEINEYVNTSLPSFMWPTECFDSTFEIVQFLYSTKLFDESHWIYYQNKNSFFGDLKSVKFYHEKSKSDPDHKFFNLSNGLLECSVRNGYYEIFEYIVTIGEKEITFTELLLSKHRNYNVHFKLPTFNHFRIFQFLINHNQVNLAVTIYKYYLKLYTPDLGRYYTKHPIYIRFSSKFFHLFDSTNIEKTTSNACLFPEPFMYKCDRLLFKQHYSKQSSVNQLFLKLNVYDIVEFFTNSNYSILHHFCKEMEILPSSPSVIYIFNKTNVHINIDAMDFTRLSYFIENDHQFIISNIKNLITHSNVQILQSILNSNNNLHFPTEFKLIVFIESIILSISSLSSDSGGTNKDLWVFNLILNKNNTTITTDQLNQISSILKINYNINNIKSLSIQNLLLLQSNSKLYLEPNLFSLKKMNLSILYVIKSLIQFLKEIK